MKITFRRVILTLGAVYIIISYIGSVARREYLNGYKNGVLDTHKQMSAPTQSNRKIIV